MDNNIMNTYVQTLTMDYSEYEDANGEITNDNLDDFIERIVAPMRYNNDGAINETAPRQVITLFEVDGIDNLNSIVHGFYNVSGKMISIKFEEKLVEVTFTVDIYDGQRSVHGIPVESEDDE